MNRDDSYQHQARKRFGQNFLVDHHVIDKIIAAIAPKPEQNIIEIGPGRGAITEPIPVSYTHLTLPTNREV